jgi:diacylglycerol kinase
MEGFNAKPQSGKGARVYEDAVHPSRLRAFAFRSRRWWIGLIRSFGFAFAGLRWTVRTQRNAQIHVAILVAVIIAGFALRVSAGEWLALILSMALVLALEAMNSAVEAVVDLVAPEYHPLARHAKDAAAGAVLLGAIGTSVVGLIVFVPRLLALL